MKKKTLHYGCINGFGFVVSDPKNIYSRLLNRFGVKPNSIKLHNHETDNLEDLKKFLAMAKNRELFQESITEMYFSSDLQAIVEDL